MSLNVAGAYNKKSAIKVSKIICANGQEGTIEDLKRARVVRAKYTRGGGTFTRIIEHPDKDCRFIHGPSLEYPNGARSTTVLEDLEQIEIIVEVKTLAADLLLDLANKCREQEDRLNRIDRKFTELFK